MTLPLGRLVHRPLPLGQHVTRHPAAAFVRYVRTPAGAKRYGVPIGSPIPIGRRVDLPGKPAATKPTSAKPHTPKPATRPTPTRGPTHPAHISDADRDRVRAALADFRPARIPNDTAATKWLQDNAPKNLNSQQRDAVNRYTGDTFYDLNKKLRAGDTSDPDIHRLDSAMRPTTEDLVVTRRLTPQAFGLTEADLADLPSMQGKVVTDHAYMSTALGSPYGGDLGGITMKVAVPKGTPAVAASTLSNNPHERELLLGRGQRLVVTKVERNNRYGWDVSAVVVPAESGPHG